MVPEGEGEPVRVRQIQFWRATGCPGHLRPLEQIHDASQSTNRNPPVLWKSVTDAVPRHG